MKSKIVTVTSLAIVLLLYSSLFAADNWEANLTVSVLNASNRLSLGQKADATDGIDGQYDVPAMLNGDISAYFLQSEGRYWRDIKAPSFRKIKIWKVRIESPLSGETIVLIWKPEALPKKAEVYLIDPITKRVINMKVHKQYSYINNGPRDLKIKLRYKLKGQRNSFL
ncbi:MAG: hypothetical protein FJ241_06890 [Nitrospira sp.]|nr:hypothetical protein [Nitrospira sp.]